MLVGGTIAKVQYKYPPTAKAERMPKGALQDCGIGTPGLSIWPDGAVTRDTNKTVLPLPSFIRWLASPLLVLVLSGQALHATGVDHTDAVMSSMQSALSSMNRPMGLVPSAYTPARTPAYRNEPVPPSTLRAPAPVAVPAAQPGRFPVQQRAVPVRDTVPVSGTVKPEPSWKNLYGWAQEPGPRPWSVLVFGAAGTSSDIASIFTFDADFVDSILIGAAFNRRVFKLGPHFAIELEGQIVRHFRKQDHWEFNALGLIRYLTFPWDNYVDTSFAAGNGLSLATSTPEIERDDDKRTSQLLNYLMFELDFTLPQYPAWTLSTRLHHRSSIFGTFFGARAGSNFLATGLKYNF